jgi:hypothetical protein
MVYQTNLLLADELIESALRPRLPDIVVDLLLWFMAMLFQYDLIFLIGAMVVVTILFILFVSGFRQLLKIIKDKHVRTEFSTAFERAWRWVPFTQTTVKEYTEIECTFDEIEEELR